MSDDKPKRGFTIHGLHGARIINPETGEDMPIELPSGEGVGLKRVAFRSSSPNQLQEGITLTWVASEIEDHGLLAALREASERYRRAWERWLDAVWRNWRN